MQFKPLLTFLLLSFIFISCTAQQQQQKKEEQTNSQTLKLLFRDELNSFNSSRFTKADWSISHPFLSDFCPSQINFSNSQLNITLEQKNCHTSAYAGGLYRTKLTHKYGKYTARFIASDTNGTISSLFTYTGPSEGDPWDEIDVEIVGKDTTKMQTNYWRNGHEHPVFINLGFDASQAMHTYSFIWHQDYIKWFVDGVEVRNVNENHLNDNDSLPKYAGRVMINLWAATGIDSWSGHYTYTSPSNSYYDFIQVEEFK